VSGVREKIKEPKPEALRIGAWDWGFLTLRILNYRFEIADRRHESEGIMEWLKI
jgi:hypothetical protein